MDADKFNGNGVEWSPYSPDLNTYYYFLWAMLKIEFVKNVSNSRRLLLEILKTVCSSLNLATECENYALEAFIDWQSLKSILYHCSCKCQLFWIHCTLNAKCMLNECY